MCMDEVHSQEEEKKATPSCMPCLSTEDRLRPRRGDDGICMCGIRKDDKSVDGKANGTFQLIKGPGRARRRNIKGKKKRRGAVNDPSIYQSICRGIQRRQHYI